MVAACIILLICSATFCEAQLDDLAENAWAVPQWDALERYRNEPLCLPCLTASDLTALPGFGRASAARVVKAVQSNTTSISDIATAACLTPDQFLILQACTTIDCSCESVFESVRSRVRYASTNDIEDVLSRVDVSTSFARFGGVFRQYGSIQTQGGWFESRAGPIDVVLGNHAVSMGTGLVLGTAQGFGRSAMSRASSIDASIRLRPWTSSWTDYALWGGAAAFRSDAIPVEAVFSYSDQHEQTFSGGALWRNPGWSIGSTVLSVPSQTTTSIIGELNADYGSVTTEVAIQSGGSVALATVGSLTLPFGSLLGVVRYSGADYTNEYAAGVSSISRIGNERGVLFGVNIRQTRRWSLTASVDLHALSSRSFGRPLPSRGIDLLADGSITFRRGLVLNYRVRHELDDEGWRPPDTSATLLVERRRSTLRGELVIQAHRNVRVRLRCDTRFVDFSGSRSNEIGSLVYADLQWMPVRSLRTTMRYTVYRAPSIHSAAYTLEVPITGMMQTVAGTGKGSRLVLSARWSAAPWITAHVMAMRWVREGHPIQLRAAAQLDVSV